MANKDNIEAQIKELVASQLCLEVSQVLLSSKFSSDLGADSLDMVELIISLEEAFEIDIPEELASSITTVEEAVTCIAAKLEELES